VIGPILQPDEFTVMPDAPGPSNPSSPERIPWKGLPPPVEVAGRPVGSYRRMPTGGAGVPRPSELLRRFRVMSVPGPAANVGVPVNRTAALRQELEPVFAALRDTESDAIDTATRAQAVARDRREKAAEQALRIVAGARASTEAVRREAAAQRMVAAQNEAEALRAAARGRVEEIERVAPGRFAGVVDELVRRVLETGLRQEPTR